MSEEVGNLQRVIDSEEERQRCRRDILAMYPDASEVYGEFYATSAAKDAKDIAFGPADDDSGDHCLVAYARIMPEEHRIATELDLPTHVVVGRMRVGRALDLLKKEHPEAFAKLLEVVISEDDNVPF